MSKSMLREVSNACIMQGCQALDLRAEIEQLRVALINMLDDGDETDRAAAMALINKTEK